MDREQWEPTDLLVVASAGGGLLRQVFLGDTTFKILRASRVPTLVLPRHHGVSARGRHAALLLLAEDALCGISGLVDGPSAWSARRSDLLGDLIDHVRPPSGVLRPWLLVIGILKEAELTRRFASAAIRGYRLLRGLRGFVDVAHLVRDASASPSPQPGRYLR